MRSTLGLHLLRQSFVGRGISWKDYSSASVNIVAAGAKTLFEPTELRTGPAACFVPLGSETNIGSRGMSYCQSVCLGMLSKDSFCGNFFLHFEGSNIESPRTKTHATSRRKITYSIGCNWEALRARPIMALSQIKIF